MGMTLRQACSRKRLRILIMHMHTPLLRYGSDRRLLGVMDALLGLGHRLVFAAKHVSGLETEEDRQALRNRGVRIHAPMAGDTDRVLEGEGGGPFAQLLHTHDFDVALLCLWFWSSMPVPALFMPLLRQQPAAQIYV